MFNALKVINIGVLYSFNYLNGNSNRLFKFTIKNYPTGLTTKEEGPLI